MAPNGGTAFDRYLVERMRDPGFAASYRAARAEIDATDRLIRALDSAREAGGMTKAELARRIRAKPEMIRRLFTTPGANPTMKTVLEVVAALGYHLELVRGAGARRTRTREAASVTRGGRKASRVQRSAEPVNGTPRRATAPSSSRAG